MSNIQYRRNLSWRIGLGGQVIGFIVGLNGGILGPSIILASAAIITGLLITEKNQKEHD
jgi:hypothetical protein